MTTILLDIDGVMVPQKSWVAPPLLSDGFPDFSEKAVIALNEMLTADSVVVLTTSHKYKYSLDEWKQIFQTRKVNVNQIKRLKENINNKLTRKEEIMNWINDSKEMDFVIIDDDKSLFEFSDELKSRWIFTNSMIGLI